MKKGFTLIELLVVIAIIAILAAILFPVFVKAKDTAQSANCLNNMKQMGMGIMTYMQNSSDRFPPMIERTSSHGFIYARGDTPAKKYISWEPQSEYGVNGNRTWRDTIFPYIKNMNVYSCPSGIKSYSHAYNIKISGFAWINPNNSGQMLWENPPMFMSELRYPTQLVAVCDLGTHQIYIDPYNLYEIKTANLAFANRVYRHQGGINLIMCDGHAKWYPMNNNEFFGKDSSSGRHWTVPNK